MTNKEAAKNITQAVVAMFSADSGGKVVHIEDWIEGFLHTQGASLRSELEAVKRERDEALAALTKEHGLSEDEKQTAITLLEILDARDYVPDEERNLGIKGAPKYHPCYAALIRHLLSRPASQPSEDAR